VLSILVWQEGEGPVLTLLVIGAIALGSLAWWLRRRKREGKVALLDADLFNSAHFRLGISSQLLQQVALGGAMIALPIFLQMVLGYNALQAGLALAPLSLSMFAVATLAGQRAAKRRPASLIRIGFALLSIGMLAIIPIVPRVDSGWWLAIPLVVAGCGLGLLVSQLNNYTLAPIADERISEAAGVNSAGGSFGLSFGLAFAGGIMLATLAFSFTNLTNASVILPPDDKAQISAVLEHDAEILNDEQLAVMVADEPPEISAEVIRINDEARSIALQAALLVPLLAGVIGFGLSFRMQQLPDLAPSAAAEGLAFG
jgi:Na+/melibiose symporter-like transporter